MNHHINTKKAGIAVGKMLGGVHLIWAILVWLGWAQGLVNFSLWAHMVSIPIVVKSFELTAAITVIIIAIIVGYVLGHVFAKIWNWLNRA